MNRKYELTGETLKVGGETLYRIRAVRDFDDVKKGDIGGWIESEDNLSHYGDCWVYNNAKVFENARVIDDAKVKDTSLVRNNARIVDNAQVCDLALILDDAYISGNAKICDRAMITDTASVTDNAVVSGETHVNQQVFIGYNAVVSGEYLYLYGSTKIKQNAYITDNDCFITVLNIGSRIPNAVTFYKTKTGDIWVSCGCFNGSLAEFERQVEETHGDNKHGREYRFAIELAKTRLLGNNNE